MSDDERLPFPGATRETALRRDANGTWFDGDVPLAHANLTRAFDAWLERADDGRWCLRNGINWAYVAVEGAPLFVRSARIEADGVRLHLSDGRQEPLDPETLREGPDGLLYCDARGGTLPARFDRAAMQALEPVLAEDERGVHLRIGGAVVRPPRVDDPLARRPSGP